MKTNEAVLREALDIALDLANAEVDSLKQSLGERRPHKHKAAADDVQKVKDAIAALAATATVAKDGGDIDTSSITSAIRADDNKFKLIFKSKAACEKFQTQLHASIFEGATPKPEASAEQPAGEVPLGYVDGRPVFVGAKLEQLTRKGWVQHNAQESWRGLSIDWKHDFRWLAVSPLERLDQAAHQIVNACADIQREERSVALAHQSPPSPIGSIGDEIAFIERVDQVASTAVDAHLCGGDFNTAKRNDEAWRSLVAYIDTRAAASRNAGELCPIDLAHPLGEKRRVRILSDEMCDGERVLCIHIEEATAAPDTSARDAEVREPQRCDFGNPEDFNEAHTDWMQEQHNAEVGALIYNGNTVSYMYSKAKNYGDVVLAAHRLIGKPGHVLDTLKDLIAERDAIKQAAPVGAMTEKGRADD